MPEKALTVDDGINKWRIRFCALPDEDDPEIQETIEPPTIDKPGLITVKADMGTRQVKQALFHGLLHAAEYTENVTIGARNISKDPDVVLDRVARCVVTMFELSPKVARFFLAQRRAK